MGVRIGELSVSFGRTRVLNEISMEIGDGEFVSLLGASGCGKSTLLKSIAGLLETESGSIEMNGKAMDNISPEKRGTVIVFQDLRLFPHMTAGKNIAFPLSIKKVPKERQQETVERLLKQVQLSGYENRKLREMSGGQMQRVALARALAAEPRLLLLDEPFSGLDERLRMEMGELVRKLHRENGLTTVLVTHDKQEALKFSDRIALMSKGRILQYDTPQEIFRHPVNREVAEYFGRMNYIRDGEREIEVRPFDIRILPSGNDCTVEEIVFMGETVEVLLGTPQGMVYCVMMSKELDEMGVEVGERVGFRVF
ncbi:MAG: ABC transporter ATP-binding protein [Dorea sp.]|uniref:ABC transporter ATP-binding protein n=1 Tax=Sporofaciens musculi TaxID=2681861 RepID=UPI00216D37A1|nr:ABC transporter ATP-binding protein [Sporofaciens musculi]MCI9421790.1 ABC transporter ATP-binding protein [Dorea sp.]